MASLRGLSRPARSLPLAQLARQTAVAGGLGSRRCVSSQAAEAAAPVLNELEQTSLDVPELSHEEKLQYRPWKRAKDRKMRLPAQR